MKLPYWIQRADLSTQHFEPIGIVEAEAALLGHDWRKERAFLKSLENEGRDSCPPGIGFIRDQGIGSIRDRAILHIMPHENRTAACHLLGAVGPRARRTAHVSDPDATRVVADATVLLQLRLLLLHFRGDNDGLQYLCDEYMRPAR
jgi:hypothetical protein